MFKKEKFSLKIHYVILCTVGKYARAHTHTHRQYLSLYLRVTTHSPFQVLFLSQNPPDGSDYRTGHVTQVRHTLIARQNLPNSLACVSWKGNHLHNLCKFNCTNWSGDIKAQVAGTKSIKVIKLSFHLFHVLKGKWGTMGEEREKVENACRRDSIYSSRLLVFCVKKNGIRPTLSIELPSTKVKF